MNSQDPRKLARSNRFSKKANRRPRRAPLSFERLEDRTVFAVNTVSFSAATQSVNETASTVTVTISRTGPTTDALVIPLTFGGTATKGTDYTTTITSSVTIGAGDSNVTFSLPITNDTLFEGNETIELTIGSSADYDIGTTDKQVVTIVDNDANKAPTFTKGADQIVTGSAQVTVNNWATNISAGAGDPNQTLQFIVTARDPSLFTVQPAIDANGKLTFTPKAGFTGKVAIDVQLKDDGGTANNGSDTSTTQTFFIGTAASINNVAPVNKIPKNVFIETNGTATFNSGTPLEVSISDADAGNADVRLVLSCTQGTITLKQTTGLNFTIGDGTDDTSMTMTGTVAEINAALNGLKFKANSGFTGVASVTLITNDLGNLGSGGEKSDNDSIIISVGASSVAGTVFLDLNGNNTQDTGELSIPNVKVTITETGNDNSSFSRTTTTDASGNYSFTELPPGNYRVTVESLTGLKTFLTMSGGSGAIGTAVTIGTSVAPTPPKFVSKGISPEIFGQFFFLASRGTPNEFFNRIVTGPNSGSTLRASVTPLAEVADGANAITSLSINDVRLAAIAVWKAAGIDADQEAKLQATEIDITDLPGNVLGLAQDGKIWLDATASGLGWFVDPTPSHNEEFTRNESGELVASGSAEQAIDLLTVLVHEMGHILGLPDDATANAHDVMAEFIGLGTRRVSAAAADRFFSGLTS